MRRTTLSTGRGETRDGGYQKAQRKTVKKFGSCRFALVWLASWGGSARVLARGGAVENEDEQRRLGVHDIILST